MNARTITFVVTVSLMLYTGAACHKGSGPGGPNTATANYTSGQAISISLVTTSYIRNEVGAASGNKFIFAGGQNFSTFTFPDSAYIYDTVQRQWTAVQLNSNHNAGAAASADGKILFAGGGDQEALGASVDIYDVASGIWSKAQLSHASRAPAGAAAGDVIAFGGGNDYTGAPLAGVDFYDTRTGTWTTGTLSQARGALAAAGAGTKIVFAGGLTATGISDVVDIYDINAKSWSTAHLSSPRFGVVAAAAGTKIVIGGGSDNVGFSSAVDIYDVSTGAWSSGMTNGLNEAYNCAVASGNLVFFTGEFDSVHVYNVTTSAWTLIAPLQSASISAGAASGSKLIFAGSYEPGPMTAQEYRLQ